mmetsp:Transcript_5980/g.13009  ORF Transcript_5980/g.13009 Transcript_5980/m.13009 type:complete len:233 (-) Transcript_5980:218-916(-)
MPVPKQNSRDLQSTPGSPAYITFPTELNLLSTLPTLEICHQLSCIRPFSFLLYSIAPPIFQRQVCSVICEQSDSCYIPLGCCNMRSRSLVIICSVNLDSSTYEPLEKKYVTIKHSLTQNGSRKLFFHAQLCPILLKQGNCLLVSVLYSLHQSSGTMHIRQIWRSLVFQQHLYHFIVALHSCNHKSIAVVVVCVVWVEALITHERNGRGITPTCSKTKTCSLIVPLLRNMHLD